MVFEVVEGGIFGEGIDPFFVGDIDDFIAIIDG